MSVRVLVKKNELLYFTAYAIWTAWFILSQSSLYGMIILNGLSGELIKGICAIILLYKMIYCDRYKVKELDLIAIVVILIGVSIFTSGDKTLTLVLLFIIAAKNIPFKKIVKISLIEISLLVLFIIISSQLGIIQNYVFYRSDGTARNSFGFGYATILGNYYLNIVLMYLYIRDNKIKYFEYILLLLINFYIYKTTDYRTGYMLIYFSIILHFFLIKIQIPQKINRILNPIFYYCVPFCAVVSIALSIFYDNKKSWYISLNKLLSSRLELGKKAFVNYGLHLFGRKIDMVGNNQVTYGGVSLVDYNYIDCSYLQIALRYGMIILIILCIAYTFLCVKEIKKNNTILCICILVIALHGIMDPQLMLIPYNVFLLALSGLLSKTNNFFKDYNYDTQGAQAYE